MTKSSRLSLLWLTCLILAFGLPWLPGPKVSAQTCGEILVNGGFEEIVGWMPGPGPVSPSPVATPVHSGSRAVRLDHGGQPDTPSHPSLTQMISIPAAATSAELSFWVQLFSEPGAGDDHQELLLLPPGSSEPGDAVEVPWQTQDDKREWQQVRIDLRGHAGSNLDLSFSVYNDGNGRTTAMVVDDVSLLVCQDGMAADPSSSAAPAVNPGATTATGVAAIPAPTSPTPGIEARPTPTLVVPSPSPTPSDVQIERVTNLSPGPAAKPLPITTRQTQFITVEVYAPGTTEGSGQGPGIRCWLYYSPVREFGGLWLTEIILAMGYAGDAGDADANANDRYGAMLGPLPTANFEYTARCSGDQGKSKVQVDTGNGQLQVVPGGISPTPTRPTPTPFISTPTPTRDMPPSSIPPPDPGPGPSPGCPDLIRNGGFEDSSAWTLGFTAVPPAYVAGPSFPVQSGSRSMRLGIDSAATSDVASYSSIRQRITVPPGAQQATISFWTYLVTSDSAGSGDRQELILLDPNTGATLQVLWRTLANDPAWKQQTIDVTAYRGRSIEVYFNVLNDGNGKSTSMFLDDVALLACPGPLPPNPLPTTPTSWPPQHPPMPPMKPPVGPPGPPPQPPQVGPTHVSVDVGALATALAVPPQTDTPTVEDRPPDQTPEVSPGTTETIAPTATPTPSATATPSGTATPEEGSSFLSQLSGRIWLVFCGVGLLVVLTVALIVRLFSSPGS